MDIRSPFPRGFRQELAKRSKATLRRTWNEGVLLLALAVMLALVAAVSLRILLVRQSIAERNDQDVFTKTFGVQQEQRELPYPGVVAGLLGSINGDVEKLHCPENSALPACRRKSAILDSVTRIFEIAIDPNLSSASAIATTAACGRKIDAVTLNLLRETWAGDPGDEEGRCIWYNAALVAVNSIRQLQAELLTSCPSLGEAKNEPVGPPGCELPREPGGPATLLPAQLSRHNVRQRILNHIYPDQSRKPEDGWDEDAREVVGIARLLDIGVMNAKAVRETPSTASTTNANLLPDIGNEGALIAHAELRQAYFISPDNLLRIWALTGNPLMELPRARLWSAAAYLRPFIGHGSRVPVKTRAYLDVGGNGVVTTECRPLWLGSGDGSLFVGAVCADLTLSILKNDQLRSELVSNRFLHIEPILISESDSTWKISPIGPQKNKWHHEPKELKDAVIAAVESNGLISLAQTVRPITVGKTSAFIVPIGKGPQESLQALIVSPERPLINWKAFRWTLALAVGTFGYLGFTLLSFLKKREDDAHRNDLVIFRSLQTGVIETLADGERIVRANDRAEEILGVRLPKKRRKDDPLSITFTEIYEIALERVNDPWPDSRDSISDNDLITGDASAGNDRTAPLAIETLREKYKVLSPADIFARRAQGRTTRYWIRLTDKKIDRQGEREKNHNGQHDEKEWVSIQAGPLVRQAGTYLSWLLRSWAMSAKFDVNKSVGAFGTVDRGSRRRALELERFYEDHKKQKASLPTAPPS